MVKKALVDLMNLFLGVNSPLRGGVSGGVSYAYTHLLVGVPYSHLKMSGGM